MKKSMWSLELSTASLILIPAAVSINYIGKFFAGVLKLPLWMDSIGTVLASMLGGPIVGAVSGAINNIIYGLTVDPISFIYALTSIAIGLTVGVMVYKGWIANLGKAVIIGVVVGFVSAIVSTPINIAFWGGQTGNIWGDAVFSVMVSNNFPIWLSSFVDELVVDLPDKMATVVVAYAIYRAMPSSLIHLYKDDSEIKRL